MANARVCVIAALLLSAVPTIESVRKKRARETPEDTPASSNDVTITFGITIGFLSAEGAAPAEDADLMQATDDLLENLQAEFLLRHADGQVPYALFSRERGEANENAHLQAHYDLTVPADTDVHALSRAEKAWIKGICSTFTKLRLRVAVRKLNNPADWHYAYGYDQKDLGKGHFRTFNIGFDQKLLDKCLNVYRAKAAQCAFSAKKMNKNPRSDKTQIAFKVGNLFVLATWFVSKHNLKPLSSVLTLPIILAYALSTGNYIVDDSLVTGKNGGGTLDPARSQAMLALSLNDVANTHVTIPLINTVLYGVDAPVVQLNPTGWNMLLPSSGMLAREFDLARARALCASLEQTANDAVQGSSVRSACASQKTRSGKFIVVDFLSSAQSAEAVRVMQAAGLQGHGLFTTNQLPNACGYNAAGWALMLHTLGDGFADLTMDTASSFNMGGYKNSRPKPTTAYMMPQSLTRTLFPALSSSCRYIALSNEHLGCAHLGTNARWLWGDEILKLVAAHSPAAAPLGLPWLSGPGPFNYWLRHFHRTLISPTEGERIHIMVVNTASATTLTPSENDNGDHWFVVAWQFDAHED
tara:strand:+ start:254 stop:2005 length:1752 start_codon:yes stop_codon:yes gene_type:complete